MLFLMSLIVVMEKKHFYQKLVFWVQIYFIVGVPWHFSVLHNHLLLLLSPNVIMALLNIFWHFLGVAQHFLTLSWNFQQLSTIFGNISMFIVAQQKIDVLQSFFNVAWCPPTFPCCSLGVSQHSPHPLLSSRCPLLFRNKTRTKFCFLTSHSVFAMSLDLLQSLLGLLDVPSTLPWCYLAFLPSS